MGIMIVGPMTGQAAGGGRVQFVYQIAGALAVGTDQGMPLRPSGDITITEVYVEMKTAPVGADIIVDVQKNGTTIFTTQANRPKILDGAKTGTSGTPDITALAKDDQLTIDLDQVGSTSPGVNITVHVRGTQL